MYSALNRATAGLTFYAFTLALTIFGVILSSPFLKRTTRVRLDTYDVKIVTTLTDSQKYVHGVRMKLGIDVDLTPVFHWNVKQLNIYVLAEFSTPANSINQVIIWDQIVQRNDPLIIRLHTVPNHPFTDDGRNLFGHSNVTLVLQWNIIPNVGYLETGEAEGRHTMKPLPNAFD